MRFGALRALGWAGADLLFFVGMFLLFWDDFFLYKKEKLVF